MAAEIELIKVKRTDKAILENMAVHYSQPKGFILFGLFGCALTAIYFWPQNIGRP